MAKLFGKLSQHSTIYTDPETGLSQVYGEFRLVDGTPWYDATAATPYPWYMAVDADSRIVLCENDAGMAMIADYDMWGINSSEKGNYTTGAGGTIYGKLWNGTNVTGLPAALLPLSAEQFYGFLEDMGEIDNFADAIETVTPTSKKMTCRTQFNNSASFSYDMLVMQLVAPKVWGENWQSFIAAQWEAHA